MSDIDVQPEVETPTPPAALEEPVEVTPEDIEDAEKFWAFLEQMIPEEKTQEIEDVDGNKYEVRTVLSARRQVKVLRCLKELMKMQSIKNISYAGMSDGNAASVLSEAIDVLDDNEEIFDVLDKAFAVSFPDLIEGKATDQFDLMEVMKAMLPFGIKAAQKMRGALQFMGTMTQ